MLSDGEARMVQDVMVKSGVAKALSSRVMRGLSSVWHSRGQSKAKCRSGREQHCNAVALTGNALELLGAVVAVYRTVTFRY